MRLLLFSLLLFSSKLYSQDTLNIDQVYHRNDLAYQVANDSLFTGSVAKYRRNGQLIQTWDYHLGVVQISNLYYRNRNKEIATQFLYDPDEPFRIMVKTRYFSGVKESTYYSSGKRILVEQEKDGSVFYSCDYSGKKKHGFERCIQNDGTMTVIKYTNGKRHN